MTTTQQAGGASPVDFGAFGDYGDYRRKEAKVNLRRLTDYPSLWAYARDLYALPAFRETTNFDHIKRHYFMTHPHINPTRIVPDGPLLDWEAPHARSVS